MDLISLLAYVFILLLVFSGLWWLVAQLPSPPNPMARYILVVIGIIVLLAVVFGGVPLPRLHLSR